MDKILTDERWDLKFIGMQIIIEGLALAAFNNMKFILNDGLLKQLLHYVIRDEARPSFITNNIVQKLFE